MVAAGRTVSGQMDLLGMVCNIVFTKEERQEKTIAKEDVVVADCKVLEKISYYGKSKLAREKTRALIENLPLTGNEGQDRLLIQQAINSATGVSDVIYGGNTVYPSNKIVKELIKMKKTDSLEKMTDRMYKFLSLNFDIAHYNKQGFISNYDGSWSQFWCECMERSIRYIPKRYTDVVRILEAAELI